ncbi:unnamed protein product [Diamesa serratosioi]
MRINVTTIKHIKLESIIDKVQSKVSNLGIEEHKGVGGMDKLQIYNITTSSTPTSSSYSYSCSAISFVSFEFILS